ncbi:MAG TPA: hypothetical protein VIJ92_08135 [Ginsengibacter sp.]
MKQRLSISVIITFLLLFMAQSSQCQSKKQAFEWATFTLPSTVGHLITGLGNYAKFTRCPNEDDCDFGATYEWKLSNGLMVDGYAMKVGPKGKASKQHAIEFIELSARKGAVIDNLIFQLSLNKSSLTECKKKFNLKESRDPNTWKFQQKNIFTYLYFNDNGILIKIGQYPFDKENVG